MPTKRKSSLTIGRKYSSRKKSDLGGMEVLNWVYNKNNPDPENPVDPAYIERLQDDMRIACERLEEQGHESFLVTVSNKGPIVMGSEKGRKFMEERMGLIEDFIYFCMALMTVVKMEDDTMDTKAETEPSTSVVPEDLAAYDDDTDDNHDIEEVIQNIINPITAEIESHETKAENPEELAQKQAEILRKNNKRKRSNPQKIPKNVKEVTVCLTKMKELKVLTTKNSLNLSAKARIVSKAPYKRKQEKSKKQISLLTQKKFPCTECGFAFKYESHLQEHNLRNKDCKDKPHLTDREKNALVLNSTLSVRDQQTGEFKTKTIQELLDQKEAPFNCEVCLKSFSNLQKLKRHMYPHAEPKPFECIICCEPFSTIETYKKHRLIHNARPYHCNRCYLRYETEKKAESHRKICAGEYLKCPGCGFRATTRAELLKHKKTHASKTALPCDVCGKMLNTSWSLLRHKQSRHGQVFPYQCKICNKRFKVELTLKRHMRVHGDASFFCKVCSFKSVSESLLKVHMRCHTDDKPFVCDFCGKQYRTKPLMENHRRLHTGERPFACDYQGCDKSFRSPLTLKQHKLSHAAQATYICDICGKGFKVPGQLRHHRKNHIIEWRWPCHYCTEKFKSCDRFKSHIAKSHPDKTKEIEAAGNIRFYPCTRCTRILINVEDLREHMNVHTGERPHKCRHCGKGFSSRKNMRQHEKSHSGEQKLKCHLCSKKYCDPVALQAHMKRLHNQVTDNEEVQKMEAMIYASVGSGIKKAKGLYNESTNKTANNAAKNTKRDATSGEFQQQDTFSQQVTAQATAQLEEQYRRMEYGAIQSHSTENSNQEATRVVEVPATALAAHMMLNFDRGPNFDRGANFDRGQVSGGPQAFTAAQLMPIDHSMPSNRGPRENIFPLNFSQDQDEGLMRVSRSIMGNSWT